MWFELACCLQQHVFIAKGYKSACQIHKIRLIWVLLVSPTLIRVLLVSLACKYALSMSPGLRQASVGFPTTCSHAFICSITYLTNFASFRELAAPHWFWHLPARWKFEFRHRAHIVLHTGLFLQLKIFDSIESACAQSPAVSWQYLRGDIHVARGILARDKLVGAPIHMSIWCFHCGRGRKHWKFPQARTQTELLPPKDKDRVLEVKTYSPHGFVSACDLGQTSAKSTWKFRSAWL